MAPGRIRRDATVRTGRKTAKNPPKTAERGRTVSHWWSFRQREKTVQNLAHGKNGRLFNSQIIAITTSSSMSVKPLRKMVFLLPIVGCEVSSYINDAHGATRFYRSGVDGIGAGRGCRATHR